MNSKVRFVQWLSLSVFLFFFSVIFFLYSSPWEVEYYATPGSVPPLIGVSLEGQTREAELATLEVSNPEAAQATREAEFATQEAFATWEAAFATRVAEHATWEAANPEAVTATREARQATLEAEYATREVVFLPQEAGGRADPAVASTTSTEATQTLPTNWTLINLWLVTLISLGTFVTTTIYRIWEERRTRTTYQLAVTKEQLEIEKLRKDIEEAQQKGKKR